MHVERLQQVFEIMGKRAQGKTCDAIEGIVSEGEEIIESFKGTAALDAGLISSAQAVEHYEITRYGTLKRWAEVLGMDDAAKLLDATLQRRDDDRQGADRPGGRLGQRDGQGSLTKPAASRHPRGGRLSISIHDKEIIMGGGILMWLLGIPIPIIILLLLLT